MRASFLLAAIIALLVSASGCAPEYIAYDPDRKVVHSIPPDKAQQGLREALSRARNVAGVVVDGVHFEYVAEDHARYSWRYTETTPRIFYIPEVAGKRSSGPTPTQYFVYFRGEPTTGEPGAVHAASLEDAQTMVDAAASLGGKAGVAPEHPARK